MNNHLECLVGKAIDRVEECADNKFIVVRFTDGTLWVVTAEPWNVGGAHMVHHVSWADRQ